MTGTMRGIIQVFLLSTLACGCGRTAPADPVDGQTERDEREEREDVEIRCGDCDDGNPCTIDACDASTGLCEHEFIDADGDGHAAARAPDGTRCPGGDCDDTRDDVYPGAPEVCLDGVDQDCDGFVDTLTTMTPAVDLSGGVHACWIPSLAWTGSMFGVAWVDEDPAHADVRRMRIARLGADGDRLGETSTIPDVASPIGVSLAWSGSEFGVAWVAWIDDVREMSFARISASGERLGPDVPLTEPGSRPYGYLHLVWAGSGYALAYVDRRDEYEVIDLSNTEVRYRLLGPLGDPIGEDVRLSESPDYAHDLALSWTGTEIGVAWHDQRHGAGHSYVDSIYFQRLAPDGTPVTGEISMDGDPGYYISPSLAWTGSEYALLWDYKIALLPPGVTDISPIEIEPDSYPTQTFGPAGLAWTGSEFAVGAVNGGIHETYGTSLVLVPEDVSPATVGIEVSPYSGDDVSIAWTGSVFGIAWKGQDEGYPYTVRILFRLVGFCE